MNNMTVQRRKRLMMDQRVRRQAAGTKQSSRKRWTMKQWTIAGFLALALAVGSAGPARADLITNGRFETKDFTGWTTDSFNIVDCDTTFVSPHGRFCAAALDAVGTPNSLKQTITTVP